MIEFMGSQIMSGGVVGDMGGLICPNDDTDLDGLCYEDFRAFLDQCGIKAPTIEIHNGKIVLQPDDLDDDDD